MIRRSTSTAPRQAKALHVLTSFRCLKLVGGAGGTLPLAVVDPDIERVEAEGVQAGQHAAGVVPAEVEDVLLHVVRVVFVLPPVVHLQTHS